MSWRQLSINKTVHTFMKRSKMKIARNLWDAGSSIALFVR